MSIAVKSYWKHFSPEVRFDSGEKYFPCSAERFLGNSTLLYYTPGIFRSDRSDFYCQGQRVSGTYGVTRPAALQLISCDPKSPSGGSSGDPSGVGFEETGFKLCLIDTSSRGCQGHRPTPSGGPPCYVSEVVNPDGSLADVTYWFLHLWNGYRRFPVGRHQGDWERVTVRVDLNQIAIVAVAYNWHEETTWVYPPDSSIAPQGAPRYSLTGGTHPVVYSAMETHASYWSDSPPSRFGGLGTDSADGRGPVWQVEPYLVPIAYVDSSNYSTDQPWVRFTGRWGGADGPVGPAMRGDFRRPVPGGPGVPPPPSIPGKFFFTFDSGVRSAPYLLTDGAVSAVDEPTPFFSVSPLLHVRTPDGVFEIAAGRLWRFIGTDAVPISQIAYVGELAPSDGTGFPMPLSLPSGMLHQSLCAWEGLPCLAVPQPDGGDEGALAFYMFKVNPMLSSLPLVPSLLGEVYGAANPVAVQWTAVASCGSYAVCGYNLYTGSGYEWLIRLSYSTDGYTWGSEITVPLPGSPPPWTFDAMSLVAIQGTPYLFVRCGSGLYYASCAMGAPAPVAMSLFYDDVGSHAVTADAFRGYVFFTSARSPASGMYLSTFQDGQFSNGLRVFGPVVNFVNAAFCVSVIRSEGP